MNEGNEVIYLTEKLGTQGGGITTLFKATDGNLATFLQNVFDTAIVIGGILAVVRLMYGGWLYMTTDIPGVKGDAKKVITDALMGLAILLGIVLILNQINPDILKLDIYLKGAGIDKTTTSSTDGSEVVSGHLGAPAVNTYNQVSDIPIGSAYFFSPSQGKFIATNDIYACSSQAQQEAMGLFGCKMINTQADLDKLIYDTKRELYGPRYRNTILVGGKEQDWCVNSSGNQVLCN